MLAGLPVIAADVGGVRDYGRDDQNMVKLSAPTAETASTAILLLVSDLRLRERLGKKAREDMLRDYDVLAVRHQVAEALSSA
jgi:glycosyltransferase involved in cell wall biosynthesis